MSLLTVIIPFPRNTATELLEETLASVLEFRPDSTDILVVNAAGYSDCYQIEDEGVRFCDVPPETSLVECVNTGVRLAKTPFVHPLLCGSTVDDGWTAGPMKRFETPEIACVIPVVTEGASETPNDRKIYAGWVYDRSGLVFPLDKKIKRKPSHRIAPRAQAAFFRRQPLVDLDGFESAFPLDFACVDMTLMLDTLGYRSAIEPSSHVCCVRLTESPPERFAWLTLQENLFRRWIDWGGRSKNHRLHWFRLWREFLAGCLRGEGKKISDAYRAGRTLGADRARRDKTVAAKRSELARRKAPVR